jgi:membrane protein implicated in regulation of membrane protease activity
VSGEMIFWGCAALLLMAAEAFAPGAFMLWLGFAAAGTFLLVWLLPMSPLLQATAFVVLSFVSIWVYLRFFRGRNRPSDRPLLNRRGDQLVGQLFHLHEAIVDGRGRIRIGDAMWTVEGPDLPGGTRIRVVAADSMVLKVEPA